MSKAFTNEENEADPPDTESDASVPGGKNYITPAGAERIRQEIKHLKTVERPEVTKTVSWAAGNGDRSENADYTYGKKRLREIDKRLRFLLKRLESAEIVDPLKIKSDQILFGATVKVLYEDETEKTYSIVGVDEIDIPRGRISWMSPLAKALFRNREGDVVIFHSPKGQQEIEIVEIQYLQID